MLCLTAGAMAVALSAQSFTLSWKHSVEHTEIQEDFRLAENRLMLIEARIKGSGAGFDPPAGARLANGWWEYEPRLELDALTLARRAAPGDWQICLEGLCRSLEYYLPDDGSGTPVQITACPSGQERR